MMGRFLSRWRQSYAMARLTCSSTRNMIVLQGRQAASKQRWVMPARWRSSHAVPRAQHARKTTGAHFQLPSLAKLELNPL